MQAEETVTRSSDVEGVCRLFWLLSGRLGEPVVEEAVDCGAVNSMLSDIRSGQTDSSP
jgi:hypothetical protein